MQLKFMKQNSLNPKLVSCPYYQERERIDIHSYQDHRYICHVGGRSFSQSKGTIFYGLHYPVEPVTGNAQHGLHSTRPFSPLGLWPRTLQQPFRLGGKLLYRFRAYGKICDRQWGRVPFQTGRSRLQRLQTAYNHP